MALVPYRRFCLRFLGGVFLPTACVLAYLIIGNWNKTVVEFGQVLIPASQFVWCSIALHTSTSLLFGSALALWFWRRGSAHFSNYEDFAGRAMSLAFWSLVGVCFAAPVAGYFLAPLENPWEGVLVTMLFGIAYQGFVGFPVFFVSVFFFGWLVFRKVEVE
jgi:hypothetical protein